MIILGVDPGTRAAGFGVLEVQGSSLAAREYGVIRCKAGAPLEDRLLTLYDSLQTIMSEWNPDVVSVEKAFFGKNAQTALTLGHARGVILLAAKQAGATLAEYAPTSIKKAVVGSGKAEKAQVEYMLRAILRLPDTPIKDDAFDALGAAFCAHTHRGMLSVR